MQADKLPEQFPSHERGYAAIEDLAPAPYNPRKITKTALTGLKHSLRRFGIVQEIVINKRNNRIVGGHQRVEALRSEGVLESIPVVWVDLNDEEEKALNIVLNSPHISGEFTENLDELIAAIGEYDSTMFDELRFEDFLPPEVQEGIPDPHAGIPPPFAEDEIIDDAMRYWRDAGFPYPALSAWECKYQIWKLAKTKFENLPRSTTAYDVADSYHHHRYASHAKNKKSPLSSFESDDRLRRAIEICLTESKYSVGTFRGILSMVRGTQAAANFRPGFACYIYRRICGVGAKVLDTSTGYGGRIVGAIASGVVKEYIGIDPNVPTHEANLRMAKDLGWEKKIKLHNIPAEDYQVTKIAGTCDAAFTSPPYFCKEIYAKDDTQSWVRYKKPDEWREGFLQKMLKLQYDALKPGCISAVNIADVRINNKVIELSRWVVEDAKKVGFAHEETWEFPITTGYGQDQDHQESFEPVYIFKKPGAKPKPKKVQKKEVVICTGLDVSDRELHELFAQSDKGHSKGPDSSFRKTDGQTLIRKEEVAIMRDEKDSLSVALEVKVVRKSKKNPGYACKKGDLLINRIAYKDLNAFNILLSEVVANHKGGDCWVRTWKSDQTASEVLKHLGLRNVCTDVAECKEDILVWKFEPGTLL